MAALPPDLDPFGLADADAELLNSGRIPDPQADHTPLFRGLARILTAAEARLRAPGSINLRAPIRLFWGLIAAVGILLLVGPVINKPLDFDDVIAAADVAETNWNALDTQVDYAVSRDEAGLFQATVDESYSLALVDGAKSSISRTIVTELNGHDVEFALGDVTIDGAAAEVSVAHHATTAVLRIARSDGQKLQTGQAVSATYKLRNLITEGADEATGETIDQWNWPLFGGPWAQGTKGLEGSLTLTPELNEQLVRAPQAHVGWLLVSGSEHLEPEAATAEGVRYSFSNDDALPPHPDIWIDANFTAGTFAHPPTTNLFWWQTYGPLVPLALLVTLLLFSLAARRIVWADSAGRPWYLPRQDPPQGVSPDLAARLLGKPRHAELTAALDGRGLDRLGRIARAGRRAGRIGNLPSALRTARSWRQDDQPVEQKLRWVPDSYVRDTLIFAPVAITLVQWGLLRQLSQQIILSAVWWPFTFVVTSTVIACLAVYLVWRPRPLTPDGAKLVQYLKGVDVFARTTRLLERGPQHDQLLPYAMLFERPRRAGNAATKLAVHESGDRRLVKGWRTEHFLSIPSLLGLGAALAVLAGAIFTVSTAPAPYAIDVERAIDTGDYPGATFAPVQGFDISGELTRDETGAGKLEVTEKLRVFFDDSASRVPQALREWPRDRLGQSLGLELESVTIDGEPVPYRAVTESFGTVMVTTLPEALSGVHDVEVRYALNAPAVEAPRAGGGAPEIDGVGSAAYADQVRWAAWFDGWPDTYYVDPSDPFGGDEPVDPMRLQLAIAPELMSELQGGGWIDVDLDHTEEPGETGNWWKPWRYDVQFSNYKHEPIAASFGEVTTRADGATVVTLTTEGQKERIERFELGLSGDLGVRLDFPAGTFTNVDTGTYETARAAEALPYRALIGLTWFVLAAAALAAAALAVFAAGAGIRGPARRRLAGASVKLTAFATLPILAIAQSVIFFWVIPTMAGDDSRATWATVLSLAMWAAVVTQAVVHARRARTPKNSS